MMKKLLIICLTVLLSFMLFGCNNEPEEPESGWKYDGPKYDEILANLGKADIDLTNADKELAEIIKKGTLVVATSPDYPPMEFVDLMSGKIKGYEMLLAQYVANSLNVELVIETMDFNAVLTAVDTGKADLAFSGFGYKADRAEKYELSIGYLSGQGNMEHTILIRSEDIDKYQTLEDFNTNITIDAQAGSLQQMYCEDQLSNASLQLVTTIDQAILELMGGKVDAVALDSTTAKQYADGSNDKLVSVYNAKNIKFDLTIYDDYDGYVCAAKKGNTELMAAINEILGQLFSDDQYTLFYYASCDAAGVAPDEE